MNYAEIWKTLSAIDVSAHVEKKQNLSYLSWAWAWGVLMQHYPQAVYDFHPVDVAADGSATVSVTVSIEGCSRMMWLPVMDHRNAAVKNPDSRKISDSKMRCLVKCLAMFGLGHYIYAGEDVPDKEAEEKRDRETASLEYTALTDKHMDSLVCIRDALKAEDYSTAKEAWNELGDDVKIALWKAPTKGGWFTTKEREQMRSTEWSAAQ